MTNPEPGHKPPALRLASANADRDIEINHAKQRVATKLGNLAAAILRTVAGSPSAAPIMQSALDYFEAQKRLVALTGGLLSFEDERQALSLLEVQLSSISCNTRYREYEYAAGMERIVRGALRSAAHQILQERESFGGKYSTQAIEQGIELILRARKGPQVSKRKGAHLQSKAGRDSLPPECS